MEEKTKKPDCNENCWQTIIILFTLITLLFTIGLVVFTASKRTGESATEKDTSSAFFPWVAFIPIWLAAAKKRKQMASKNEIMLAGLVIGTIILIMVTIVLVLLK